MAGMGDFIDGLGEATRALEEFASSAGSAGGSGARRASAGAGNATGRASDENRIGRGIAKTFGALGGISAVGRIGGAAVEGGMGTAGMAGISALQGVPLIGAALSSGLGLTKQKSVFERTSAAVASDLSEFARYGIDIPQDFLEEQIGIRAEQQGRVFDMEKNVRERVSRNRKVLRDEDESSSRDQMTNFEKLATAIDRLSDFLENAPLIGGGGDGR